jgi:hypothetical protein
VSGRVSPVLRTLCASVSDLCASVSDLCASVAVCAACWQYGSKQGLL